MTNHLIETGEITPFDAINLQNSSGSKILLENEVSQTSKLIQSKQNKSSFERNNLMVNLQPGTQFASGQSLIDRIKASSRECKTEGSRFF